MKHIAKFISYHPKLIAIVAVLLLIPAALGYIGTYVNYDLLSYLPEELDSVKGEVVLDETFNSASMSFLVLDNMPAKDTVKLKEKIAGVEGVSSVIWVDDIADISIPESALPEVITQIFYNPEKTSTLMLIRYDGTAISDATVNAISEIREIMGGQCLMSGLGVIMKDTMDLTNSQAPIFIAIAVVTALIIMSFCMESWVLPLILLAALSLAVAYNMGTNIFFGEISYITQCIAAVLQLGVTMDYSVFLIDRFEEEKPNFTDKRDAMTAAIQQAFTSLTGSSLTTVFGFLALCFMDLSLGKDIGIVMAKGVAFGVITVILVLPSFILLFDKQIHKYRHRSFIPKFDKLNGFILKHKKVFISAFVLLFIPAYLMQANVDVYYSMDKMLPAELPCISALNKLKNEFNMATSHFIIVDDDIPASQLVQMQNEIKELDGITLTVAYNSFVGSGIPDSMIPEAISSLAKAGGKQMMLVNTSFTSATDECNEQLVQLEKIVKSYDPSALITGEGAMYKDLIDVTDHDFKLTSVLSILSIFLLVAIIFKSISIPTVLVLSIELAILINKAISFAMGTEISFIAPTVIGCVQLGATVDYAILLTTRFREEIRNGRDRNEAILIAANSSDRSILQSALVFFGATFGVFVTCDISIVRELCSMLARGSLISAGVIIFMLTPLLVSLEGIINKTTIGFRKNPEPRIKKAAKISDGGAEK